jgi:hypothetical protein
MWFIPVSIRIVTGPDYIKLQRSGTHNHEHACKIQRLVYKERKKVQQQMLQGAAVVDKFCSLTTFAEENAHSCRSARLALDTRNMHHDARRNVRAASREF